MHETNGNDDSVAADPLAQIVRAAGRRAAPPQSHYDQVFQAAHATWRRRIDRRRQRNWYALAAALAVAAIGGVIWQAIQIQAPRMTSEVLIAYGTAQQYVEETDSWADITGERHNLARGSVIRTGSNGGIALQLTDGGSLRLSRDSQIVLDADSFTLSAGTLYFDSAGRPTAEPIEVITALGSVRDVGTQFEVRTAADTLRVRVRSGSVAVRAANLQQPVAGVSGEEIRLDPAGQIMRRAIAADDPEWDWVQSLAVAPELDSASVMDYLEWIANETGKTLEFESETVRLQAELARFRGNARDLRPAELLMTIAATSDFSYEITNRGTILIGREVLP